MPIEIRRKGKRIVKHRRVETMVARKRMKVRNLEGDLVVVDVGEEFVYGTEADARYGVDTGKASPADESVQWVEAVRNDRTQAEAEAAAKNGDPLDALDEDLVREVIALQAENVRLVKELDAEKAKGRAKAKAEPKAEPVPKAKIEVKSGG